MAVKVIWVVGATIVAFMVASVLGVNLTSRDLLVLLLGACAIAGAYVLIRSRRRGRLAK